MMNLFILIPNTFQTEMFIFEQIYFSFYFPVVFLPLEIQYMI
jgi:hypothetical protein